MVSTTSVDKADRTGARAEPARTAADACVVEIHDDIEAVAGEWRRLEAEGAATPFQTMAWARKLYGMLAPRMGARPVIALVRDRPGGTPLMLLPLCARRIYGFRVLEFADLGVSDYNAPILAPTFNPSAAQWRGVSRRIVAALAARGAVLRLTKMPRLIRGSVNPLVAFDPAAEPMEFSAWCVALPTTSAEFWKRPLDPSFARELAKKFRRVAKHGAIEYAIANTPEEKRVAFEILTRQRQSRFEEMGRRTNALAQEDGRRFYQAMAMDQAEPQAKLAVLKVGDEIVGTLFALARNKVFHVIMSTFEGGEWKSCSLGNVLLQSAIEHCIDGGFTSFDLTIGDEGYKQKFGARPSPLYASWLPLSPAGAAFVLAARSVARIKRIWTRSKCPERRPGAASHQEESRK